MLVGGAAGGVGVFVAQLARLAGATVLGTASEGTFPFLRDLGAEPIAYGEGLHDRVRASAPGGISAAIDLFGTETIETALALGVAPDRIVSIAAGPTLPGGARAVFGNDAAPDAIRSRCCDRGPRDDRADQRTRLPIEQIREAAALQPTVTCTASSWSRFSCAPAAPRECLFRVP